MNAIKSTYTFAVAVGGGLIIDGALAYFLCQFLQVSFGWSDVLFALCIIWALGIFFWAKTWVGKIILHWLIARQLNMPLVLDFFASNNFPPYLPWGDSPSKWFLRIANDEQLPRKTSVNAAYLAGVYWAFTDSAPLHHWMWHSYYKKAAETYSRNPHFQAAREYHI